MEEILICVISDKYPDRKFLLSLPGYLGYETKVLILDLNNQTCGRGIKLERTLRFTKGTYSDI